MDFDWEFDAELLDQPTLLDGLRFGEDIDSSGTHLAQGIGGGVQLGGSLLQIAGKFSRSAPSSAGLGVW